jgi:hypothetical protein
LIVSTRPLVGAPVLQHYPLIDYPSPQLSPHVPPEPQQIPSQQHPANHTPGPGTCTRPRRRLARRVQERLERRQLPSRIEHLPCERRREREGRERHVLVVRVFRTHQHLARGTGEEGPAEGRVGAEGRAGAEVRAGRGAHRETRRAPSQARRTGPGTRRGTAPARLHAPSPPRPGSTPIARVRTSTKGEEREGTRRARRRTRTRSTRRAACPSVPRTRPPRYLGGRASARSARAPRATAPRWRRTAPRARSTSCPLRDRRQCVCVCGKEGGKKHRSPRRRAADRTRPRTSAARVMS